MALFGKKKEDSPQQAMPPDMGAPPPDQYAAGYEQYPQEPYPQEQYPPGTPMEQQAPMGQPAQAPPMGIPPAPEANKEKIVEIAEAIVEEKWKEKEGEISKIDEWKEQITIKVTQLEQQITDLKSSFDSLHKGMLGKISEYDENLTNVGTEIKAMEKVFSKVLPSLTDSVNKLGRMSSTVKKK